MPAFEVEIVRSPTTRSLLATAAAEGFGDMLKAVVDTRRGVMAIGGELHADEEAALIDDGSDQHDLWGINLYPAEPDESWVEFDSMINVRPAQGNRSRGVDAADTRDAVLRVLQGLVTEG